MVQVSALWRGQRVRVCQLILSRCVQLRPAESAGIGPSVGCSLLCQLEVGLALGAAGGLVAVEQRKYLQVFGAACGLL